MTRAARTGQWIVLYDGECGFCRWCTAVLVRVDRRHQLAPRPLADPSVPRLLAQVPPHEWATSWHLVAPSGRVHSAGRAVIVVCGLLPGFGGLGLLCRAAPNLTEWVYAGLARRRRFFGRFIPKQWIVWATKVLEIDS